ncbi:IS21 family transposase [Salsuginibacillus halophilus]|nr:IS21 family transposase [Salsuginibacillus halophilus]
MPKQHYIKDLRNREGCSINDIAKRTRTNWRTAKKYADEDQVPEESTFQKRGLMYDHEWGEIIRDWIQEDLKLPKKSRRSRKKMHEQLQDMGFPGSYRTVCNFIQHEGGGHSGDEDASSSNLERLEHPPGAAQLDFGTMDVVENQQNIDVKLLVLSLPYSNSAFAAPLPSENQECLLHGLKRIFEQMEGVPQEIWIDNLKPAVAQPRKHSEEAVLTEEFERFAAHYGVKVIVCNPYSGHEKGHVENKVGYLRYQMINPAPAVQNLEDLNQRLYEQLKADRRRLHYEKNVTIEALWQEERKVLRSLPEKSYPVFRETRAKTNKYGEVRLDQTLILIPRGSSFPFVHLVLYWDTFKAVSPAGEILYEGPRPYSRNERALPWLSIMKDWLVKPRVVNHSRYTAYLPGRLRNYLLTHDLSVRKQRIRWMIQLLVKHDIQAINEQFYDLMAQEEAPDHSGFDIDWSVYDQLHPQHVQEVQHDDG